MDHGPHRPTPLPSCFWSGVVRGGTSMPSEGRREAGVCTHQLPPVAAPLTLQPPLLPGGPCPWLLVTGSETPRPPLTSAVGLGVLMAPSVP